MNGDILAWILWPLYRPLFWPHNTWHTYIYLEGKCPCIYNTLYMLHSLCFCIPCTCCKVCIAARSVPTTWSALQQCLCLLHGLHRCKVWTFCTVLLHCLYLLYNMYYCTVHSAQSSWTVCTYCITCATAKGTVHSAHILLTCVNRLHCLYAAL